jgi:multidrug efflux pump subunit AcrA (membrane-fusion protein)
MNVRARNWLVRSGVVIGAVLAGLFLWRLSDNGKLPDGIVAGNGRIEAIETDVAAKAPGRLLEILVDEGQMVGAGELVARIDAATLQAKRTAIKRFGTSQDIANAAIFLASQEGGYITGTILDCDGGMKLGDASGDFLTPPER